MSGSVGSKEQRSNAFHEVCRDPDSSRGKFRYQAWVRNLEPGAAYAFRIRAFNGFGPGPYTWETFTTRPRRPNAPVLVRAATASLHLFRALL
jgi:hypothetical protein